MRIFSKVTPIRFWSQKVLPLVYDQSLSYYEVLDKLTHKINEVIGVFNEQVSQEVSEIIDSYFMKFVYDESSKTIIINLEDK